MFLSDLNQMLNQKQREGSPPGRGNEGRNDVGRKHCPASWAASAPDTKELSIIFIHFN
jgi:hypothetical protein